MASKTKKKSPEKAVAKTRTAVSAPSKTGKAAVKAAGKDTGKSKRVSASPAKAPVTKAKPAPARQAAKKAVAKKTSSKPAAAKTPAKKAPPKPEKAVAKVPAKKSAAAAPAKKAASAVKVPVKKAAAIAKPKKAAQKAPVQKKVPATKAAAKPVRAATAVSPKTGTSSRPPKTAEKLANRPMRMPSVAERETRAQKEHEQRGEVARGAEKPKKGPVTRAGLMTSGLYAGIKVCENPGPLPERSPYSDKELEKMREQLKIEREEALQSLRYLDNLAFSSTSTSGDRETPGYSTHPAEYASDYAAADTSLGLRNIAETRLAQVDEALQRLNEGLYGVCVACGSKVGIERLKVKPFAVLCVPCRSNYEKLRSRGYGGEG